MREEKIWPFTLKGSRVSTFRKTIKGKYDTVKNAIIEV